MTIRLWLPAFGCLLLSLVFFFPSAETAPADDTQGRTADRRGIVTEKPSDGVFVQVEEGYMVPYMATIPGTDIEFEMVPIPGGTYMMGSPEDAEEHKEDEGPQVQVTVAPMWVGKHEVKWDEYQEFMGMYKLFKTFEGRGLRVVDESNMVDAVTAPTELYDPSFTFEFGQEPLQPAVTMTQYAAKQYTKWLSKISGEQYRLPTEAEWEYACRAGTTTPYSWGEEADDDTIEQYAVFGYGTDGPLPVGSKKPNPFGLYDMHGNVAELCIDEYTENGYEALADKENLTGITAAQWPTHAYPRVVRGGSWESDPPELRSAARMGTDDELWKDSDPNIPLSPWWYTSDPARGVGFRLVRSYSPLPTDLITKFWELDHDDIRFDVESRLLEGRGVLGLVGPDLPDAEAALE